MPHIHLRRRGTRSVPFVVGMGQIDFGATRVPTGGTSNIALTPKISVAPNLSIPGYVTSAPTPPPRTVIRDTPATRVMGGPSILGAANRTPLPTGYATLDTGIDSARSSTSSPSETSDGGEVAMVPAPSPDGLPFSTSPSVRSDIIDVSSTGPVSVDGTVEVPDVNTVGSYEVSQQFHLPFGMKWWHLAVAGGLVFGTVALLKRRK